MKRLEAELERTARSQTLPRILAGDRCMLMDYYRNYTEAPRDADFIKEIAKAPVRQKAAMLIIPRAYFKCDQLAFVDMMDACMAAVRGPRPQGLIEAFHLTEEVNGEIPPYYMLARTTPRHIGYVIENTQIHIARCDTARVVLACLRRRSAKGALPDTLGALVPDYIKSVPLDPFVGGQLRYKRTPRGFVVYALGKNKRDDGGDTEGFVDVGCRVRLMKPDF